MLFVLSETTTIPYAASTSVSAVVPYCPTTVAVGDPEDAMSTPLAVNCANLYLSVPTPRYFSDEKPTDNTLTCVVVTPAIGSKSISKSLLFKLALNEPNPVDPLCESRVVFVS